MIGLVVYGFLNLGAPCGKPHRNQIDYYHVSVFSRVKFSLGLFPSRVITHYCGPPDSDTSSTLSFEVL